MEIISQVVTMAVCMCVCVCVCTLDQVYECTEHACGFYLACVRLCMCVSVYVYVCVCVCADASVSSCKQAHYQTLS